MGKRPCPRPCLAAWQARPARSGGQVLGVKWWVHALYSQVILDLLGHLSFKGRTHPLKDQASTQHRLQSPGRSRKISSGSCSSIFKSPFRTFGTSLPRFGGVVLPPALPCASCNQSGNKLGKMGSLQPSQSKAKSCLPALQSTLLAGSSSHLHPHSTKVLS